MNKTILRVIVALNIATVLIVYFTYGYLADSPDTDNKYVTKVIMSSWGACVLISAAFVYLWDNYIWRCKLINPRLIQTPNLNGTWRGSIKPVSSDEIEAFASIVQSYSKIQIRVFTRTSSSSYLVNKVLVEEDGAAVIVGVYYAEGQEEYDETSYGGSRLRVAGSHANRLLGKYWTNGGSRGEVDLTFHSRPHTKDFESAMAQSSPTS